MRAKRKDTGVGHTFLADAPDAIKVATPTYVRRVKGGYEYGLIRLDFNDRRHDTHVPHGIAVTYEAACDAVGWLSAQAHMSADIGARQ